MLDLSEVYGTGQLTPLKEKKKASNTWLMPQAEKVQDYLSNQKIRFQGKARDDMKEWQVRLIAVGPSMIVVVQWVGIMYAAL